MAADLPTVADPEHIKRAWAFYENLGKPKTICAPMVSQSELPFRLLCRKYNTDLCYTPMINSGCFARDAFYRETNFTPCAEDRPLVAQFAGDDPDVLLAAALHVQDHVDAVDLNLGCPQDIARRGHYGSFLLEQTALLESIVRTMSRGLKVPVTCKIRILEAGIEPTLHLCRVLQAAGCSILTVHGRTRKEKKQFIREADWDAIKRVKAEMQIPVFANGGIENFADVERCLAYTGVDGVMSSEALLEFPALFSGQQYCPEALDRLASEHLDLAERYPEMGPGAVRAHLFKYLYTGLMVHTDLRDRLAQTNTFPEFRAIASEMASRRAVHEYGCTTPETCGQPHSTKKWYRRFMTADGRSVYLDEKMEHQCEDRARASPTAAAAAAAAAAAVDDGALEGCTWF